MAILHSNLNGNPDAYLKAYQTTKRSIHVEGQKVICDIQYMVIAIVRTPAPLAII